MDQTTLLLLIIAVLTGASIFIASFALITPKATDSGKTSKRVKAIRTMRADIGDLLVDTNMNAADRRKQVSESLKRIEEKEVSAKGKTPLHTHIERAGFDFDSRTFIIGSLICGFVIAAIVMLMTDNFLVLLGSVFAGTFGLPIWYLKFMAKRRQKAFGGEFVNSVEVIVRGVEAGLPLNECLRIISKEAAEPVCSEFKQLVDAVAVGLPLEDELERLYERMPLTEVNFFAIVLTLQMKTGGNLAETLKNLADVLRARKLMQAKIKAMSSEAKASAAIIGMLPPGVAAALYFTTPDYISVMFREPVGQAALVAAGIWMFLGILAMKKMVSFGL